MQHKLYWKAAVKYKICDKKRNWPVHIYLLVSSMPCRDARLAYCECGAETSNLTLHIISTSVDS